MNAECKEMLPKIKDKRQFGHAIMKINDTKTEIVMEETGPKAEGNDMSEAQERFDRMRKNVLESGEPRYILFDFKYRSKSGGTKDVVVYIYW